ncbi:hypothetical protein LEP1GSC082_1174 [Leptospira kirschneri str. H2]|nr:hypothetical protein LEP1GSC082_1174 [Leptospira kirschneri str. H2]
MQYSVLNYNLERASMESHNQPHKLNRISESEESKTHIF